MFTNLAIELGAPRCGYLHPVVALFQSQADADYATRGINSLQKFKEQVIQSYLGDPLSLLGRFKRFRAVFDVAFFWWITWWKRSLVRDLNERFLLEEL